MDNPNKADEINTGSKVALVPCRSYEQMEVDEAVAKAIALLGGFEEIFASSAKDTKPITKESRLVLKPNLLAKNPPEKACTTHPAVFQAAGRLLQQEGYANLTYGDSPGNPMIKVEKVAEECQIKQAADALGIPLGAFEHGSRTAFPEGRSCTEFILCDEILEADGIINLCKMKTHQLERITGAVKNTFGCVFGVNKGAFHARFTTPETFADMIADLNALTAPKLHIMDGITAMEGNGPQSGVPKNMNVILASTDPVALDTLFCHLVHLDPALVPTNVSAQERGVGSGKNMQVITALGVLTPEEAAEKYGDRTFDVHRNSDYRGKLQAIRFLVPFLDKKPVVKNSRCIGCGICVESCPLPEKAIRLEARGSRRIAAYQYDRCIKCYCCQEMCPKEAIGVKKSILLRIADHIWKA